MKLISYSIAGLAIAAILAVPAFAAHHEEAEMQPDPVAQALADPDRADWERARDPWRAPQLVLQHLPIEPGDRVADMGAGGGYFTHILANMVGPTGHVYGQNPQVWVDNYGANWPEQHGNMTTHHDNVEMIVAPFNDLGIEVGSLDAVTMALIYHDIPLLGIERSTAADAVYNVLRPGGHVLITDHHSNSDDYYATADTLHRGNEAVTIADMEAAGFELVGSYDDLVNPDDDLSLLVFNPDIRGQTSRFILVFRKPE